MVNVYRQESNYGFEFKKKLDMGFVGGDNWNNYIFYNFMKKDLQNVFNETIKNLEKAETERDKEIILKLFLMEVLDNLNDEIKENL